MRFVDTSRKVEQSTAKSASILHQVKALVPGRMMSRTPVSPTAVAVQRRQPTRSARKTAEAAVTISGFA